MSNRKDESSHLERITSSTLLSFLLIHINIYIFLMLHCHISCRCLGLFLIQTYVELYSKCYLSRHQLCCHSFLIHYLTHLIIFQIDWSRVFTSSISYTFYVTLINQQIRLNESGWNSPVLLPQPCPYILNESSWNSLALYLPHSHNSSQK